MTGSLKQIFDYNTEQNVQYILMDTYVFTVCALSTYVYIYCMLHGTMLTVLTVWGLPSSGSTFAVSASSAGPGGSLVWSTLRMRRSPIQRTS